MEKRLLLAVLLSIAFLFTWGAVAPRLFPDLARRPLPAEEIGAPASEVPGSEVSTSTVDAPGAATGQTPSTAAAPSPTAPAASGTVPASERIPPAEMAEEVVIERPQYRAVFRNRGAQMVSFQLKEHQTRTGELVDLVEVREANRIDFPFALVSGEPDWNRHVNSTLWQVSREEGERGAEIIRFRASDPAGRLLEKEFRFTQDWAFGFEIRGSREVPYRVIVGPGIRASEPGATTFQGSIEGNALIQTAEGFERLDKNDLRSLAAFPNASLVGIQDNYFIAALRAEVAGDATVRPMQFERPAAKEGDPPIRGSELYVGLNHRDGVVRGTGLFLPKEADLLDRYGLEEALNLGFFGLIARGLLIALQWIHTYTNNYGWAIVLLTVVIKLLLYPLQHKSMVSMKKMQKLQPKMNAIKDKYKKARTDMDQRQKMNQEMMQLYSREGINPMSGCFPILLQLPILWAFYSLLSTAIELRGAEWIWWINDLSAKDPYYITPILMTVTMFLQQLLTPMTGDAMQRRIFLLMPLIFGWIFKEFPSGLVLYWLVQNVLTIFQQLMMNRYWKEHPEQLAGARA